jgi:hypothetical protein
MWLTLCARVRPRHETSMHYFSCSGGPSAEPTSMLGHVTPKLCYCIWCDLWVTFCVRVCLGHEMSTHCYADP